MKRGFPILTGAAALTAIAAPAISAQAAEQPNVLLIYIDDMGIGDVGCYGSGKLTPTPNIDQLAKDGLKFDQYYSAAPVSSASRVGVTTGSRPQEYGINTFLSTRAKNAGCEQRDFLDDKAPSLARALHNAGYATGHFGKWHMGGGRDVENAPSIHNYGFDEYVSTYESPDPDPKITARKGIWSKNDEIKRWDRTQYFITNSMDFMARCKAKKQPFYVNLWPDDVHTPWVPESSQTNKKGAMAQDSFNEVLAELDVQIGRLIKWMDENDLSKNTIVIFTSDNGPSPSFNALRTTQLRGCKNSLYDGGIRMPFIVKYPKVIKGGEVNKNTVLSALDLYPTICDILDVKKEAGFDGDGEVMSSALLGKEETIRKSDLIWDFGRNEFFRFPRGLDKSPHLAIRRGKWKLLTNADGSQMELYDMESDKYEKKNIISKEPKLAKSMSEKVIAWFNEYKDQGKK